ncbi:DUF4156 domain-containing protein [Arsenophonus endosymbiont of Bemisia tabaci]|uniref:DUF4156 domain-containing protein n=1 Tax=Arsenophonus endosymbiont of Bemisia tabaci TaxID=536059 RepID=UPI0030B83836
MSWLPCSTTNKITTTGEKVRFVNAQAGSECRHLGSVTGTQSNWLSGVNNESSSLRVPANDLGNKVFEMGGNVIYGANSPTETLLLSFIPTDSNKTVIK